MKIAMVDLKKQYATIKEEIDAAIHGVLDTTQFIMGKNITDLENGCSEFLNVKHAIACASGTDALQIAMMALDIKPGDEIITTPFTFVATAETIALLGAIPVYVDIDAKTYNIDPSKIEASITNKTKAIIPVHLYGQSADMDAIMTLAKKYNLAVIEDAAQAFGTEYKGKKVSGIGTIAATSFFPSKNLGAYGDAGMMFTNDDSLAEKLRMISQHGSKVRYIHEMIGINSRMDALQAAILKVKLKYISKWNAARAANAKLYIENLSNADVVLPYLADFSTHIYHQFSIQVKGRDGLQNHLSSNGIPTAIHYPIPLHKQPAFVIANKTYNLPVAESISNNIISLPMYPELTREEINYISETIIEFTGKR